MENSGNLYFFELGEVKVRQEGGQKHVKHIVCERRSHTKI